MHKLVVVCKLNSNTKLKFYANAIAGSAATCRVDGGMRIQLSTLFSQSSLRQQSPLCGLSARGERQLSGTINYAHFVS